LAFAGGEGGAGFGAVAEGGWWGEVSVGGVDERRRQEGKVIVIDGIL
jgi:hypothetical protein